MSRNKGIAKPDLFSHDRFCPTSFEIAALWSIAVLEGTLKLPSAEKQKEDAIAELAWMQERTGGKHSHGTNLVPFSLHNIDDMLKDLNVGIGIWPTLVQWLLPVNPAKYTTIADQMLKKRLALKKEA